MKFRKIKRTFFLIVVISLIVLLYRQNIFNKERYIFTYLGKEYEVNDEHKKLLPSQVIQIENAIYNEKPVLKFNNYGELMDYFSYMSLPDCGSSSGGFGNNTRFGRFTFFSIQIPNKDKFRVFIYFNRDSTSNYIFFKDFYYENPYPPMFTVVDSADNLRCVEDKTGKILRQFNYTPL